MWGGATVAMALETEALALDEPTVRKGVDALLRTPDKGFYVIAEAADGTPVGQLMVTSEWSDWNNGRWLLPLAVTMCPGRPA